MMEENTMGLGLMIKCMDMGNLNGQVENFIRECIIRILNMAKEKWFIVMGLPMKEHG
jgi:hypothetical protein